MVVDSARNHIFVTSQEDSTVIVGDETLLTEVARIPVSSRPSGIAMLNDRVYVGMAGSRSVASNLTVIDAATLTAIKQIPFGSCEGSAQHVAVNPLTHRVYVALHGNGRVAVIDGDTDTMITCVSTNTGSFGIATHPASNSIFVGNRDGLDLWRIDGATNTATRVVNWADGKGGGSPYYIAVNPTTNKLFAMVGLPNADVPNQLYVYDIGTNGALSSAGTVTVGNTGEGGFVLQSQCSGLIYIAETGDNTMRVLNSNLTLNRLLTQADGVGQGPFGLAEGLALGRIYLSNQVSNSLSVFPECR